MRFSSGGEYGSLQATHCVLTSQIFTTSTTLLAYWIRNSLLELLILARLVKSLSAWTIQTTRRSTSTSRTTLAMKPRPGSVAG